MNSFAVLKLFKTSWLNYVQPQDIASRAPGRPQRLPCTLSDQTLPQPRRRPARRRPARRHSAPQPLRRLRTRGACWVRPRPRRTRGRGGGQRRPRPPTLRRALVSYLSFLKARAFWWRWGRVRDTFPFSELIPRGTPAPATLPPEPRSSPPPRQPRGLTLARSRPLDRPSAQQPPAPPLFGGSSVAGAALQAEPLLVRYSRQPSDPAPTFFSRSAAARADALAR